MEQGKIWNHFQNDSAVDIFKLSKPRYQYLANHALEGSKVLNIGVGRGGLESLLQQRNVDVYCLDPGEDAIQKIRIQLGLAEKAKVGYSQSIPFANASFDMVIMTEVLEHLEDAVLEQTISEVCRVLKPLGKFIGTVPADESLEDGTVLCPHCGESFHRWGHVQSFDVERLVSLFSCQFKDVTVSRHFFGDWGQLNWKGRTNWLLKKTLLKLGAKGSTENYAFLALRGAT